MKLFTKSIRQQLLRNGELTAKYAEEGTAEPDFLPIVKLFTPDAQCTWLLSEIDPIDPISPSAYVISEWAFPNLVR